MARTCPASAQLTSARRLLFFVLGEDRDNVRRHAFHGLAGAEDVSIARKPTAMPVCTENLIRIDLAKESPGLTIQVEKPL